MTNKIFNIYLPEGLASKKEGDNIDKINLDNVTLNPQHDNSSIVNTVTGEDTLNMPATNIEHYKEVSDYSFLNIVTEEIVSLNSASDVEHLKGILKDSFDDVHPNIHAMDDAGNKLNIGEVNFDEIMQNFSHSDEYKVFLHNVSDSLWMPMLNQDEHIYSLTIENDGVSKIDNNSYDHILNNIIDHQSKV